MPRQKKAPELTFQQHIADFLVREHKYGVLEQADITDSEHLIAERTKGLPPRIQQLMRLAEVAGLEVSGERAEFLRELSAYCIQMRYPEEIKDLASQAKKEEARRVLDHTEEVLQWLNSML